MAKRLQRHRPDKFCGNAMAHQPYLSLTTESIRFPEVCQASGSLQLHQNKSLVYSLVFDRQTLKSLLRLLKAKPALQDWMGSTFSEMLNRYAGFGGQTISPHAMNTAPPPMLQAASSSRQR